VSKKVSNNPRLRLTTFCALLTCAAFAYAQDNQQLDRQFQSAVAQFDAGHFSQAATQLEALLPLDPNSFEIHELLGQSYASLSRDDKAIEHLQAAVRLKPKSAPARTNLAASLWRAGKTTLADEQFRKALELEPQSFLANHNLGEFSIQFGKIGEALPFLEQAQRIDSTSYDNGYDLAQACFLTGRLNEARQTVQSLLGKKNTAELHNLLGQIEEKDGKFITAANEFQTAAHMDPTEDNLFDWGSEMLLHRTYEPAIAVFEQATLRYPKSPRLSIGLGLALYWRGKHDEAVQALLKAADLNPSDPRCYLFLSKTYDSAPNQAEEIIRRFRRFAELQPGNALAQYYLAMSLWKGKRAEDSSLDLQKIESLLRRSIALDAKLPEAHVQLGNLYADQHLYDKSIAEYARALEINPDLSDAHYRLGTDYVHTGQKERAQKEFEIYQKLRSEHLAEIDKERAEVQQFIYSTKAEGSSRQ